jgi:hypothetical protein
VDWEGGGEGESSRTMRSRTWPSGSCWGTTWKETFEEFGLFVREEEEAAEVLETWDWDVGGRRRDEVAVLGEQIGRGVGVESAEVHSEGGDEAGRAACKRERGREGGFTLCSSLSRRTQSIFGASQILCRSSSLKEVRSDGRGAGGQKR